MDPKLNSCSASRARRPSSTLLARTWITIISERFVSYLEEASSMDSSAFPSLSVSTVFFHFVAGVRRSSRAIQSLASNLLQNPYNRTPSLKRWRVSGCCGAAVENIPGTKAAANISSPLVRSTGILCPSNQHEKVGCHKATLCEVRRVVKRRRSPRSLRGNRTSGNC